jgi:serine/threonine-protein kinase RsbW/stage II sporulation protein AB (anti-sigma F factor)
MLEAVAARGEWDLPAEPESVSAARTAVREFAAAQGVDELVLMDVALAVTEAVTNAVLHAFLERPPGTIRVTAATGAGELTVVVTDDGIGMRPRPDSPGLGLGLPTIGRLAALVDLRVPEGGGTELSMTFVTPGVRGPVEDPDLLDAVARTVQGAWPGEGVERLVDLLVPAVADACAVDVIDPAGYPERFAGRIDSSEADSAWLTALRPRADVPRSATQAALKTGDTSVSELTLDLIGRITTSSEDADRMAATGIRWWVVVPLREGDRLLGLLHFGMLPARGRPPDEVVAFLTTIGDHAAAALAHRQLLAELQRSRRRFEHILDVLTEAVTVRDVNGRVVYANAAARELGDDIEGLPSTTTTLDEGESLTVTVVDRVR